MRGLLIGLLTLSTGLQTAATAETEPYWLSPMKRTHARFTGQHGIFAQFGDSITDSRAFWTSLKWKCDGADKELRNDYELVKGYMVDDCWDRKGGKYGNQSRMTSRWALKNIDTWLKELNPEVAIVMFGTNDLNSVPQAEYESNMRTVVQKCLDNGTLVLLSTIPPRNKFEDKSARYAETIRKLARELCVPLVDFHGEILRRRPDDWNGALDKFAQYKGYDVPTLISRDGVHPSNPKQYVATYTEEALRNNGFSLRNYLVLRAYAEVIRAVLKE